MTLTEQIAEDTWSMLKQSWEWKVRLGEETLTDLLILNFTRFMPNHYKLLQTYKKEESRIGADLEIRVYAGHNRATVFAVQAKKLSRSGRYESLNAKVKSSGFFQIDVLERYSQHVGAIPLYLLYNYVDHETQRYWHCCQYPGEKQLGCTLVPSWNIRQAISMYGHRNFDSIHASCAALPWRCLFDCPKGRDHRLLPAARRSLSIFREPSLQSDNLSIFHELPPQLATGQNYSWVNFEPMDGAWPKWLWEQPGATLWAKDRRELWGDFGEIVKSREHKSATPTEDLVPRRLLLVKKEESPIA